MRSLHCWLKIRICLGVASEVAASIGAQLEHMELTSMPTGLRRRIRDVISRVQPKRVCEVGSGIGHLSAWLFDYWSQDSQPEHFDMIEAGGKFGVILTRLLRRYDAEEWAHVRVGEFETLCAEMDSWKAANATLGEALLSTAPSRVLHMKSSSSISAAMWARSMLSEMRLISWSRVASYSLQNRRFRWMMLETF